MELPCREIHTLLLFQHMEKYPNYTHKRKKLGPIKKWYRLDIMQIQNLFISHIWLETQFTGCSRQVYHSKLAYEHKLTKLMQGKNKKTSILGCQDSQHRSHTIRISSVSKNHHYPPFLDIKCHLQSHFDPLKWQLYTEIRKLSWKWSPAQKKEIVHVHYVNIPCQFI